MRSVLTFFALTYTVTWTIFIAAILWTNHSSGEVPGEILQILILPGVFAPALVAIAMTARTGGAEGLRALLDPLFQWRVGARWFAFAAGYLAAVKLTVALIYRVSTGAWPRFGDTAWYVMAAAIVISTPVQAGEEIGWRGFALPQLAQRLGFARASIVVGVVWATWHLPLFFLRGADTYHQSFFVYLLQVTALSVAMAWLYAHTGRSLLLPMVMHAAINNTLDIVPSAGAPAGDTFGWSASPVGWLTLAVLWICAAYFLIDMRRQQNS